MGLLDSYGDQLPDLMPDVGQNQKPEPPAMPEPPKLRSAMRVTQGMQPDQLANDMRMGKTVGLPADFVAADREAVKQKIEEDNAEQALAGAPATRRHLAGNPHTMALTKDDLPNAARLEAILTGEIQPSRTSDPKLAVGLDGTPYLDYSSVPTDQSTGFDWLFKSASQALKAGGYNTAYGLKAYGHMVAGTDPTKDQALMALLDEAKQAPQANGLLEKMWAGGFGATPMLGSGMLRGATYGAAASGMAGLAAAPLAGGLAATGVGAPAGAAVEGGATAAAGAAGFTFGMFHDIYMQTSGAKYAELIQQGVDPATAQKTAMAVGGVNAALMSARFSPAWLSKLPVIGPALEKAGAQQAIDQVLAQPTIQAAAKDFIVHVAKDTGKNGVLGASMAVVDQLGTTAAMGVQQGLEGQDLLKFIGTQASSPEFWQHAAESGKNMAIDMAGFAIIPGARGLVRDFQAVERAKTDRAVFEALDENVGQSKLRERMPDAHADLVEAIREQNGGTMPENVYVDPKALREASGLQGDTFYQMLTQIGVDPADFNRSEALDAPLAIPMKDYASRVAGTDLSAKLRGDMKFDPEGMTAREAQAFEAERDARVTELKQQYEQNKEQHDADFEAAKQEKFSQLMDGAELQGGVKMTRADAEAQLAPMFKMAERAAERWRAMGSDVTAADLLRKVPIRWEEPGKAKGNLYQITPEVAKTLNYPIELPADQVFHEAVQNTPGAQVTPDGLLINLTRFQKGEQAGGRAIRTGVFYLPAKSADARHYRGSNQLGYGGEEQFTGETLLRKPLFVKGATGGKAPEQAYSDIKGKDALKEMAGDAYKAILSTGNYMRPMPMHEKVGVIEKFIEKYAPDYADSGLADEIVMYSQKGNTLRYALQELAVAQAVRDAGYDSVVGYYKKKVGPAISEVFDVREQTFPSKYGEAEIHDRFMQRGSADLAGADLNDPAIVADAQKQWAEKGTESPYFKQWFGDSKVVDEKGQPLVVYHGTKSDFEAFNLSVGNNKYYSGATENALFFSDSANTASGYAGQRTDMTGYRAYYADGGNVVPSYLSMKKPLKVSAKGDDWQNILYKGRYYTMPELVALAQGRGNDGIIVSRVLDFRDPGPKGFEADKPQTTYAVFSPEQIKSIHNRGTFDSSDPRILNQEPVQKKDLVAAHNLSEQNLHFADKIGGLPVPSIGITKAATPFDGFGNITLIGHKDMVDPSRGVPVFSADAYSARFPEVLWPKVKTKDAQKFMNESRPYFDEFKDGSTSNVWDSLVNSPSRDRALEDFTRGRMLGARAMYADQVLGKKVDAPIRDVPHEHLFVDEQLLKDTEGLQFKDVEPGRGKDAKAFTEAVKRAIDRKFAQMMEQAGDKPFRKNLAENLKEGTLRELMKDGELTYGGADSVLRDIRRAGEKEVDVAAAEKQLDALVPKEDPAFLKWAADKIGSMFGDPSIKVGGRKVPMSLENLVDAMSTRNVRGKEKTMTFSNGRLAAEASKQFKSIEEIQAERDRVVSPEDHNADVKSADKNLEAYRTSVLAFFTQKDYRGDIDTWAGLDAATKALADAAKKGGGEQSIRSALTRNGFKGVNARTVSLAKQALDSVKQAKVDYFEAKPQRGVKLNEFMGAVIPAKTSPEARAILEKNGLHIAEYDGTPEGRAKALDSLSSDLEQQRPGVLFQPAYHGSPYRFDKFTLDHIGSGEGAQAFGYGLYFAGQKSVSEWYRKNLAEKSWQTADGSTIQEGSAFEKIRAAIVSSGAPDNLSTSTIARNIMDMVDESKSAKKAAKEYELPRGPYFDAYKAGMDEAVRLDLKKAKGQLYKVEIPEDHQLLLWDKPLSEQPEEVRKALEANIPPSTPLRWRRGHNGSYEYYNDSAGKYSIANYSTGHVRLAVNEVGLSRNIGEYNSVSDAKKAAKEHYTVSPLSGSGKDIYLSVQRVKGSARAASEYLNSIGIKGIKYLDGTSRADGEGSHNYVIFDDKAVQIAKMYYQELMAANRSGTKGSITFDPEQAVIRLFKGNADFSTLLHETAHYFVREMQNMVETGRAPEQVFKDLETMAKFAGDLEGVPAQEKLARAFELYLREGKAPSPEMVKPFQRFQAWLTAIYRNVKAQLGLEEVPTEMRGVFDRMLAADDEIRAAEEATAKKAELEASYLTPAEQKRIADLTARSHAEAVEKRTKRYVSAYLKAIGGKAELEKQARAEIEAGPVYKAIDGLTKEGGLPTASVDAIFGAKTRAELGRKFPGLMELKDNTAPKADLWLRATAHGFDSADTMVAAIMEKPSKGEAISKLTEQKMAAEEARLRASLTGEEVPASEDIHNDATLSRLSLEATALERKIASEQQAKQAVSSPFNASVAREVARDVLKDETVSRAGRYDRYAAAERKAGIEADRLIKAGKWQEALAAKQREALNHALVIEAVKARDLVAKQVKTIIREAKAKKLDFEAREQIMALTATYGIGPRGMKPMKPEELTGIRDYFTKVYGAEDDLAMNPVGFFNDWSLNREQLGNYKNLTVSQLNELHALVSALADAGGSEYTRMASEATMTRQAQLDKMIESVNNSGYQTKQYDRGTTTQKATSAFRDVTASLQRMPDLFRNADGNVDAAPKNAHLMGPNQEFAERLHLGSRKTLEILYSHKDLPEIEAAKVAFAKRFKKQFGERTPEVNGVPVPPVRKVEGMHTWTAESIWCAALNMGNEGNLRTLIQGDGLTMDQLVKLTSVLSERDWKAIQAQWDLLGKHYAETDKVFRKVYNFPMPNRVKPKELTVRTAEGNDLTLPGGYFPIKVDRDINPDIGAKQDQDLIKGDPSNKFAASIAKGHTKERLGTSRPVSLSYEVAHRAMLDQARFIALAPIIKDAQAIYTSPEYRRAMIDAFGKEAYDGILPWLKNIASPTIEGKDHFDNALSKLRHLSTLYILGLNLKSATKQYLGLAGTANKLGVKWTASGLTEMAKWGGMGKDFVDEKSAFMRNREEGLNPELAEINAKARGSEFRLFGIKTGLPKKKVVDAVMVLTRLTDRHVTYSTWLGAYKKGLQELGLADSEAVDFADRIVRRTQMSGSAVDTTGWQRSEGAKRLLTMFMSEAIPKSSRMRSDFTAFKNGNMTAAQYGRSLFYETIAPAVGYTALMGLMGGEDKKSWFKDLFWQLYSETFGLFPLLGGVQSAVEFNKPVAGTPSLEALDIFTNVVKSGIKLLDDHSSEGKARMYKALIDATAYMHGVGNLRRIYETAAEGWKDIDHNKTVNPFRLFIRKPKDQ